MNAERCHNCGQPADPRGGLPVAGDGITYVAVGDKVTEWAGVPACEQCRALYVAAGERCNGVLAAYLTATQALRHTLDIARQQVRRIDSIAGETLSQLRAEP